ncbi:MAG TPA: hypothetical protein VK732_08555 [Verrucomicrobiae bacterium]|nr:hypothetical protein [Verrucomicrobiae bacterium]
MDLGTVAIVSLIAGFTGGAVGAALVGTVETMLRRQIERSAPNRTFTLRSVHTYTRKRDPK